MSGAPAWALSLLAQLSPRTTSEYTYREQIRRHKLLPASRVSVFWAEGGRLKWKAFPSAAGAASSILLSSQVRTVRRASAQNLKPGVPVLRTPLANASIRRKEAGPRRHRTGPLLGAAGAPGEEGVSSGLPLSSLPPERGLAPARLVTRGRRTLPGKGYY